MIIKHDFDSNGQSISDSERSNTLNTLALTSGGIESALYVLLSESFENSTIETFNSYASKNTVFTNGVLDKDFNHLSDKYVPQTIDKIRNFLDNSFTYKNYTTFKTNKFFYIGYFYDVNKKYFFRKFPN